MHEQGAERQSGRREIPITHRQRDFFVAYLRTGCAAKAARAAGYRGRYAAQAGYKLLRCRVGTSALFTFWSALAHAHLRRDILRSLRCVSRAVLAGDLALSRLDRALVPLTALMAELGLGEESSVQPLTRRQSDDSPRWRRRYSLPWENEESGPE